MKIDRDTDKHMDVDMDVNKDVDMDVDMDVETGRRTGSQETQAWSGQIILVMTMKTVFVLSRPRQLHRHRLPLTCRLSCLSTMSTWRGPKQTVNCNLLGGSRPSVTCELNTVE